MSFGANAVIFSKRHDVSLQSQIRNTRKNNISVKQSVEQAPSFFIEKEPVRIKIMVETTVLWKPVFYADQQCVAHCHCLVLFTH